MRVVVKRVRVASENARASCSESAGSGRDHAALVLLQARSEEGVARVAGGTARSLVGRKVAALTILEEAVRVLELSDLYLKHAFCMHQLKETTETFFDWYLGYITLIGHFSRCQSHIPTERDYRDISDWYFYYLFILMIRHYIFVRCQSHIPTEDTTEHCVTDKNNWYFILY